MILQTASRATDFSAYFLIYIKDNMKADILQKITNNDVPSNIREKFELEQSERLRKEE